MVFQQESTYNKRMETGDNPRSMVLNTLDLWVQIHDLPVGFMSERVVKEVGNYVGVYIESCARNYTGGWKEYMRARVRIELSKALKRRMKIRKSGNEWQWINFKYENVPTFCFICGIIGHSEKFCGRLFDLPEGEITKPYGAWMRAPFRRQTRMIGAQWLRTETGEMDRNNMPEKNASDGKLATNREKVMPTNQENIGGGFEAGNSSFQNSEIGSATR